MSRASTGAVLWLLLAGATPTHGAVLERTGYVMGTMLSVVIDSPDSALAARALDTAFALTSRLDCLLSNYRPDSELSRIGREAPAPVSLSPLTLDFLSRTLSWCDRSAGALDPTVGTLVHAWGFDSEHPARPEANVLDSASRLCGYRKVRLDTTAQTASMPCGFNLDPGATGKGYALAVVDRALLGMGVTRWNADFGGQLFCRGTDSLLIPVRHPRSDTTALAWLTFALGSVSTSGDYERYFDEGGKRYAHILDPRTKSPVQGRASVTVYAPDAFDADALSTALFVLGPQAAGRLLEQAGAGALFAEWNGETLELIIVGAWPSAR